MRTFVFIAANFCFPPIPAERLPGRCVANGRKVAVLAWPLYASNGPKSSSILDFY